VLETASVSYGKATTYFPVIELLRGYFGIEPRDDNRKIREKITGKLFSLDRALEPTLPVFLSLLDVPVEDAEWTKLDPSQRRRQTLDALKRLLLRESQVQRARLGKQDVLPAAAARRPADGQRGGATGRIAGDRPGARGSPATPDRTNTGQSLLPRGEREGAGGVRHPER
jgi:hypothetical protein